MNTRNTRSSTYPPAAGSPATRPLHATSQITRKRRASISDAHAPRYTYPQADDPPPPSTSIGGHGAIPAVMDTATVRRNVVTLTSAGGGVGLSTFCAMLAWELRGRGLSCALADADFISGGLDLLLGLENEPGLRFGDIDAPLGHVDGQALNHELPTWQGVRVLAHDPWNGEVPDWWEVQAAIRALADVNQVVVVDGSRGEVFEPVPELATFARIVAAELSVLGLARAKAHLERGAQRAARAARVEAVIGFLPRGMSGGVGAVGIGEASDYLSVDVMGPVRADRKLQADLLEGFGIKTIVGGSLRTVQALAARLIPLLGLAPKTVGGGEAGDA